MIYHHWKRLSGSMILLVSISFPPPFSFSLFLSLSHRVINIYIIGNLVFANEEAAQQAIQSLLASDVDDPVTHQVLRKAKAYTQESSDHVFNNLHIRIATTWDIKEPGARDRSRYYLLHGGDNPFDRSELPKGGVFDRLGNRRKESTRRRQQHQDGNNRQRRRSLSPQSSRSSSHHHQNRSARDNDDNDHDKDNNGNDDHAIQIPDSLKGRIGSRRPR